jgi:hypothetical protein
MRIDWAMRTSPGRVGTELFPSATARPMEHHPSCVRGIPRKLRIRVLAGIPWAKGRRTHGRCRKSKRGKTVPVVQPSEGGRIGFVRSAANAWAFCKVAQWPQAVSGIVAVPPARISTATPEGYKEEVVDPIAAAKMAEVPGAFVLRRKPPRGR